MNENTELDSWTSFTGSFLKAEDVESENDAYIPISISSVEQDGKKKLRLHLERNEMKKDFDLNVTNLRKVIDLGFNSPKSLIGSKVYFKVVQARDPNKNIEVPALRIYKIDRVE